MNSATRGLVGIVIYNKQRKEGTIKVQVSHKHKHPKYNGYMERKKCYFVHLDTKAFDASELEDESFLMGKTVSIVPCAPVSKRKRFAFGGVR